jgi:hypothetical protein
MGFFTYIDITAVIGLKTKIFNEQIICSRGIKKTDWLFQKVEERPNNYTGKIVTFVTAFYDNSCSKNGI